MRIPNWKIGTEMLSLSDCFWNSERLEQDYPELSKVDIISFVKALEILNNPAESYRIAKKNQCHKTGQSDDKRVKLINDKLRSQQHIAFMFSFYSISIVSAPNVIVLIISPFSITESDHDLC